MERGSLVAHKCACLIPYSHTSILYMEFFCVQNGNIGNIDVQKNMNKGSSAGMHGTATDSRHVIMCGCPRHVPIT